MGQRQKGSLSTQTCQNSPSGPLYTLQQSKPTFIHVSLVIIDPSTLLGLCVHTIRALSGDEQIDISHLDSVSHCANFHSLVARLVHNTISHGRFTHHNRNGSKKGNASIFPLLLASHTTGVDASLDQVREFHRNCWCSRDAGPTSQLNIATSLSDKQYNPNSEVIFLWADIISKNFN